MPTKMTISITHEGAERLRNAINNDPYGFVRQIKDACDQDIIGVTDDKGDDLLGIGLNESLRQVMIKELKSEFEILDFDLVPQDATWVIYLGDKWRGQRIVLYKDGLQVQRQNDAKKVLYYDFPVWDVTKFDISDPSFKIGQIAEALRDGEKV